MNKKFLLSVKRTIYAIYCLKMISYKCCPRLRLRWSIRNFWRNMDQWFHQPINRTIPLFLMDIMWSNRSSIIHLYKRWLKFANGIGNSGFSRSIMLTVSYSNRTKNISHRTLIFVIQLNNLETLLWCESFHDDLPNDTEQKWQSSLIWVTRDVSKKANWKSNLTMNHPIYLNWTIRR